MSTVAGLMGRFGGFGKGKIIRCFGSLLMWE